MSTTWFYLHNRKGTPVSARELKTLIARGELSPSEYVRREGNPGWIPAASVIEALEEPRPLAGPILLGPSSLHPPKPGLLDRLASLFRKG